MRRINLTKTKTPMPIKMIQERLKAGMDEYPDWSDKFTVTDATVRRVIKSYIKK